jgi:NAD(P)-dependent dehydrogenase (short-subunit alcohol dehydrogenase family)
MFDLTGKVALVAGGTGWLGLPVCSALAKQGAAVVVASRSSERVSAAVEHVRRNGASAQLLGLTLEMGDEASIREVVQKTIERFGRLDTLVNATFHAIGKPLDQLSGREFDEANRVHITGSFLLARTGAEAMVASGRGGSIIQYSSMYGLVSPYPKMYEPPMQPNPIEYGVAKAALCQMVRYLAAMYGPKQIRVNALAPGPFNTDADLAAPGFDERVASRTMLGRTGRRDETAGPVVFLASDEAAYVTGAVICVDGGWTAW